MHKEECTKELSGLKNKLKEAETKSLGSSTVPSKNEITEDAYRQTIAEADSLLSKLEADYQTTIKYAISHKAQFSERQITHLFRRKSEQASEASL